MAFPSGDFLDLALEPATVQYLNLGPGIFHFVFVGTAADTSGQSLPYGLTIGDTVSVALAMTISGTPANNGTDLTSFKASGTGTIEGAAIPEPTALALLALAAVGLAGCNRGKSPGLARSAEQDSTVVYSKQGVVIRTKRIPRLFFLPLSPSGRCGVGKTNSGQQSIRIDSQRSIRKGIG